MKDFIGQDVVVGDRVVCLEKGYNNLIIAVVTKITPQNIKVVYQKRYSGDREVLRNREQFIKVEL